jgi:hypothetical protein
VNREPVAVLVDVVLVVEAFVEVEEVELLLDVEELELLVDVEEVEDFVVVVRVVLALVVEVVPAVAE